MRSLPKKLLTSTGDTALVPMIQRIVEKITSIESVEISAAGFVKIELPGKKGKSELVIHDLRGSDVVIGTQGKGRGKRFGKYLLDIEAMESALLSAIGFTIGVDFYVIHEIGPVETMSRPFSEAAKMLLKNDKVAVLASVAKQGRGFVREVKRLPGLDTIEINENNASSIEDQLLKDFLTAFVTRAKAAG